MLAITTQPLSQTVIAGQTVTFSVRTNRDDVQYEWYKDGAPLEDGVGSAVYRIPSSSPEHAGEYSVRVALVNEGLTVDSDPPRLSVRIRDAAPPVDPAALVEPRPGSEAEQLEWDAKFAAWSAGALAFVLGVAVLPLWRTAIDQLPGTPPTPIEAMLSVHLLLVGVLTVAAAFYLLLLELRGRSRTAASARRRGLAEVVTQVPDILRAFGSLRAPAALLIVAIIAFLSASALAWRSIPEGGTPIDTTTTTAELGD